jgi:hypothetical protein
MVFFVWVSWQISQTSPLQLSTWYLGHNSIAPTSLPSRERHKHRVFEALLQMVPSLQEQLLEGGKDNVVMIVEMVHPSNPCCDAHIHSYRSYKKVHRVLDLMTPRVWKVWSWTGLHLRASHSVHLLLIMSS